MGLLSWRSELRVPIYLFFLAGRPLQGTGVSKQILLPAPPQARSTSPLALPLEPEPEFRKPLAPAARQGAMSAAFRDQIGQLLPKFSNRRGRQSRNRAKQVVGRQLLQPLQPAPPPQVLQSLLLVPAGAVLPTAVLSAPVSNGLHPGGSAPGELACAMVGVLPPQPSETPPPSLPDSIAGISPVLPSPHSPPQISIPSPRRSPSPTPSFSCLMDLTFPESTPSTPTKGQQGKLLITKARNTSKLLQFNLIDD